MVIEISEISTKIIWENSPLIISLAKKKKTKNNLKI